MSHTAIQSPAWIWLPLLLGCGFILGIVFRSLVKTSPSPPRPARFGVGMALLFALTGGVLLLGLGYTSLQTGRQSTIETDVPHPLPMVSAPTVATPPTISVASNTPTSPIQLEMPDPPARPFDSPPVRHTIQPVKALSVGALALLVGVGVVVIWSLSRRTAVVPSAAAAPAPVKAAIPPKSRLSWLVVPAGCFAALGFLAAPNVLPPTNPEMGKPPALAVSTQERMDKIVRDLVSDVQSKGADEIQTIPDWIKDKPLSSKNQFLLSSQQYSTRREAEEELLPIAADLLQRAFHEHLPWQGTWNVPLAQVRERVVEHEFAEQRSLTSNKAEFKVYRVHMLINVSPEVCETFTAPWKAQIVERRLQVVGVFLAWLTGVLLLGRAYFWSLTIPNPIPRWAATLKASVMTMGLTAIAGWVLMAFIH